MLVKARRDKNNEWGFLEKYEYYRYFDEGYVKALVGVTIDRKLTPVFVFKGNEFVPLSEIDKTVGIDKYIKAKKPFYSKVKDCYVVVLKAKVNFVSGEYFPDKSTFEVYTLNGRPVDVSKGLPFKRVLDVPKEFVNVVREPLRLLGESLGDREKFLRSRLYG